MDRDELIILLLTKFNDLPVEIRTRDQCHYLEEEDISQSADSIIISV